jgi:hypothetical protein
MGEYGFITADNVYHVTVYATDENGNFKIISMKNIKLQPGGDNSKSFTSTTPQPFTVKTTQKGFETTTYSVLRGEPCASCRLLPKDTETVKTPIVSEDETSTIPPPFKIVSNKEPATTTTTSGLVAGQKNVNENVENSISSEANKGNNEQNNISNANSRQPSMNEKLNTFELSKNKLGNFGQPQTQQLPNNNNNFNRLNQQSNNDLLYRFDYATDFQGHKEEGDQAGNKNGEYYSIGRDNIKRIVSYKANEFGFMPNIRQQSLNQNELRDERNNQLRHYNFEWFYPNNLIFDKEHTHTHNMSCVSKT